MENFYPTDLATIKDQLITFFKKQNEFKDYNFEGSGITEIMNLLAYSIRYHNMLSNFSSSELFLKTAQIENNVYKKANTLNYIPKRKSASYINLNINRTGAVSIVIPKYSVWELGSLTLTNISDIIISNDNIQNINLYEGEIVTETFISDGSNFQTIELSYREEIDNENIYVFVDEPDGVGGYILSSDEWLNINTNNIAVGSKGYYINYFETMQLKFDDNTLYEKPQEDYQIRVIYLKTSGSSVNGSTGNIQLTDAAVVNKEYLNISDVDILRYGTDEESIEAIKLRAPQFYTTQNRAVTEQDYNILLETYSKYDNFHSGLLWGGEKEYIDQNSRLTETELTKDLGHVYISLINSDYSYLEQSQIDDFTEYLNKYKFITIFFRFLNPVFLNIKPIVNIKYKSNINLDLVSMENQINEYLTNNNGFNKEFYLSDLIRFVDSLDYVVYTVCTFSTSVTVKNDEFRAIRLNGEIVPNSINSFINGYALTDNGLGYLYHNSVNVGTINYDTGFIIINNDFGVDTYEISFEYVDNSNITCIKETFLKNNSVTLNIL